jgi:hypothetical protein
VCLFPFLSMMKGNLVILEIPSLHSLKIQVIGGCTSSRRGFKESVRSSTCESEDDGHCMDAIFASTGKI